MYQNEHMDISSADAPNPPTDGGTPQEHPQTFQQKENAHITYWYPWNIPMHREPTTEWG